jgi:hypothetical protein
MSLRERVFEHQFTTMLGAVAGVCTLAVPSMLSGAIHLSDVLPTMGLAICGALLKDPKSLRD